MASGIYLLRFSGTEKVYVGQSHNISARYADHLRRLKASCSSKKLQEAFSIYGTPTLETLLECPIEELNELENLAILQLDAVNNGFNTLETAEQAPDAGHAGEEHWNSSISNNKVIEIIMYIIDNPGMPLTKVSNKLNVSYLIVKDIAGCAKHTWVNQMYPDLYSKLLSLVGTRKTSLSSKDLGILYPPIISPEGIIYTVDNITQFAKEHGLNSGGLYKLLNKQQQVCKGFKIYEYNNCSSR